jgi:hypothetical protein
MRSKLPTLLISKANHRGYGLEMSSIVLTLTRWIDTAIADSEIAINLLKPGFAHPPA